MHEHNFKWGKVGERSHCDTRTGVMQICNAPNPNWGSIIRDAPVAIKRRVNCIECDRWFDLLDETDAQEWYYGHDCEV